MTQLDISIVLEDNAKPSEIKKILKNIKGVVKVSTLKRAFDTASKNKKTDREWLEMVDMLQNSVDPSNIDMTDERTRYIMGER